MEEEANSTSMLILAVHCVPMTININKSIHFFNFHLYISFGLFIAVLLLYRDISGDCYIDVEINLNAHFFFSL